ncbi:unnamed protein product [Blepharisma stoltei]|uniref:Uncharacterized protein n=1 Tax=Blepharisma stoltei TaxID=1481888 RepID=A0AAU9KA44_9CILI|nr:unnamed protein product [Blepharisma stoltei]
MVIIENSIESLKIGNYGFNFKIFSSKKSDVNMNLILIKKKSKANIYLKYPDERTEEMAILLTFILSRKTYRKPWILA